MIKIDEFAFCFFSSEENITLKQEEILKRLSDKYSIEKWYRAERNKGNYNSFSQMVNDAIDDTTSEFMIFCNPKTNFDCEDIEFILEKLSLGYCFASVVSFGFFGFSKELIRNIGMLDERFIGGEYEDDDFCIRLKILGKAVWWGYNYDKYEKKLSRLSSLRGISKSIFFQKYKIQQDSILVNENQFLSKKISQRHNANRKDIFDSWIDSSNSVGNGKISEYLSKYHIKFINAPIQEVFVNFNLILERNGQDFRMEMITDQNINVYVLFVSDFNDGRSYLWDDKIQKNQWKTFKVFSEKRVEFRIFLGDNQIYNNTLKTSDRVNLEFNLPTIVEFDS